MSGNAPNNSILHNLLIEKFLKMQREPSAQKRPTEKDNKSDLNIIEEENAESKENSSSKSQKVQTKKEFIQSETTHYHQLLHPNQHAAQR